MDEGEDEHIMAPCIDFIRDILQGVQYVSRFGCRYYGLGLATSDFDVCFMMHHGVGGRNFVNIKTIRGHTREMMASKAEFREVHIHAVIGVVRAADVARQSSDIIKRALERRTQPQRDVLLTFMLLAHNLRFAQWPQRIERRQAAEYRFNCLGARRPRHRQARATR